MRMNQRRRRKSTVNPDDLAVFAQPSDSEPGSNASNFAPESSLDCWLAKREREGGPLARRAARTAQGEARGLAGTADGLLLTEHFDGDGAVLLITRARWAWRASCPSAATTRIGQGARGATIRAAPQRYGVVLTSMLARGVHRGPRGGE